MSEFINVFILYQEKQEENELRALPPASTAQLKAVDAAVLETARQQGISEEDFEVRKAVVNRMNEIIKQHLSGCRLWCLDLFSARILFVYFISVFIKIVYWQV